MRIVEIGAWGLTLLGVIASIVVFWNHVGTHDTAETNWLLLGLSTSLIPFVAAFSVGGIRRALVKEGTRSAKDKA